MKMLSMKTKIGNVTIDDTLYPGEDFYCDGPVEDELLEIGFEEYVSAGGVCVIEWPQNVEGALPKHRTEITIEKCGENERKITVTDV